jgi:hypothetical protein
MRKILTYLKNNIIIPFLKFSAPLLFFGLLYSGYYFYKLKYTCELDEVQAKKDGWITLRPGFSKRKELPKDYTQDIYEQKTVRCYGEVFIQIRKK